MTNENKITRIYEEDKIVAPNVDPVSLVTGDAFDSLCRIFDKMSQYKKDRINMLSSIKGLKDYLKAYFGLDCTIALVDSIDQIEFYGFNIFPSFTIMNTIINSLDGNHDLEDVSNSWKHNKKWHIDIDAKFFDLSNKLTAKDIAILFLYSIDQVIFDYKTPIRIAYSITKYKSRMNFISTYLAQTEKLKMIYAIPFMLGCSENNYLFADTKARAEMESTNLVGATDESFNRYLKAVQKLLFAYGKNELIDQSNAELEGKINYILDWIYEGLNDLRYSFLRVIENIKRQMHACRSPYIRIIFRKLILILSDVKSSSLDSMSNNSVSESTYINPEKQRTINRLKDEYWKNYVARMEATIPDKFLDNSGHIKKVSQSDLDMIRVDAEDITSTDDKIYLLERLYKYIGIIDTSLSLLESKNKNAMKKVKQSKNELLNLKEYAGEVRQYIIKFRIIPEHYGLYIKYPNGFEG